MTAKIMYQTVGNAIIQWREDSPLCWTMQDSARDAGILDPIHCDLSRLIAGYDENFLLALKEVLISLRHRVQLPTILRYSVGLELLLAQVYAKGFEDHARIKRIDTGFLTALNTVADEIPSVYLESLKQLYQTHRDDQRLFERDLSPADFPTRLSKRGPRGDRIHRILAKALRRSTLVHILDVMEMAFEQKEIDLSRYAFIRLALNIFCRISSYRQLTLADLRIDKDPETGALNYFLAVSPAKSRVHNPKKILYGLHPEVGRLMAMQQKAVIENYGTLAPMDIEGGRDYGQLAFFPASGLKSDGSGWISDYANASAGMLKSDAFQATYIRPVKKLTHTQFSLNSLRHTIGTQLAQMGCSAHTIQAVLKHASDSVCKIYVDITFQGLIDELSDALKPGFDMHFPVFTNFVSTADAIPLHRRIDSADLEATRVETTGMCGRHVACSYAPIACYACPRFIPCVDADHSINLDVVQREIVTFEGRGLAMQHEVQRWKTIRNYIRLVITACDNKRRAMEMEAAEKIGD